MAFKANGRILKVGPTGGFSFNILANMKEGFLGSGHVIKIKTDRKFFDMISRKLGMKSLKDIEWTEDEKVRYDETVKSFVGRSIDIIIK